MNAIIDPLRHALTNGITLIYSDRQIVQTQQEPGAPHAGPRLALTFALEGYSRYLGSHGESIHFHPRQTTLASFDNIQGERCYPAQGRIRQLRLLLNAEAVRRYIVPLQLVNFAPQHGVTQHLQQITPPATVRLVTTLISQLEQPVRPSLAMEIQMLRLLAELLSQFPSHDDRPMRLRPADQQKILQIKTEMQRRLAQPLTLSALALSGGINLNKLKQGFQQLFNCTPYQMLLQIRMENAWQRLAAGEQVAQVAYRVGYQHASSFSKAFSSYYGRTPKSIFGRTMTGKK